MTEEIPEGFELTRELVESARRNAYQVQSDPLFFEWQRIGTDEAKQAWLDKVDEIKALNPYPAE